MSCHVMLCHVFSRLAVPCRIMACHLTSCHVTSCHGTSCDIMSRRVMSLSRYVMSRLVIPCPIISCHIMPRSLCHVMSRHVISRHVRRDLFFVDISVPACKHDVIRIIHAVSPGGIACICRWSGRCTEATVRCYVSSCPRPRLMTDARPVTGTRRASSQCVPPPAFVFGGRFCDSDTASVVSLRRTTHQSEERGRKALYGGGVVRGLLLQGFAVGLASSCVRIYAFNAVSPV